MSIARDAVCLGVQLSIVEVWTRLHALALGLIERNDTRQGSCQGCGDNVTRTCTLEIILVTTDLVSDTGPSPTAAQHVPVASGAHRQPYFRDA